jgi:hypothetical protein
MCSHHGQVYPQTYAEHIDKIIFYLRAAENFRKYNKYVYAFRLEDSKGMFVTEPTKNKNYLEGFNEDTTLEGNGEKLLHLLQKFSKSMVKCRRAQCVGDSGYLTERPSELIQRLALPDSCEVRQGSAEIPVR